MSKFVILEGPKYCGKTSVLNGLKSECNYKSFTIGSNVLTDERSSDVAEFMIGAQISHACMFNLGLDIIMDRGWLSICFYHNYPVKNKYFDWWMDSLKKWDVFRLAIIMESDRTIEERKNIRKDCPKYYTDCYKQEEKDFFRYIIKNKIVPEDMLIVGNSDYIYKSIKDLQEDE